MNSEVRERRHDHNVSPDSAIGDVACALRKNIDQAEIDRVLARLPPPARSFWQP